MILSNDRALCRATGASGGLVGAPGSLYIRVMTTVTSKTFRSGNSQAVRLPKEVAFSEDIDVTIVRSGDVLTIYPKKKGSVADMIARLRELPGPGEIEQRDSDFFPDRGDG